MPILFPGDEECKVAAKQPMLEKRRKAYTFAEILITLSLLGLLASMLLPMLSDSVGKDKLLALGKDGASEISQAFAIYVKNSTLNANTRAQDIVSNLNYVRMVSDGSMNTQLGQTNQDASAHSTCTGTSSVTGETYAVCTTPCDATTPCALLQTGALLQYDAATPSTFNGTGYNTNAIHFIYDPDGTGPQFAIAFTLFYSGRITTETYSIGATTNDTNLPSTTVDPPYILDWTNG